VLSRVRQPARRRLRESQFGNEEGALHRKVGGGFRPRRRLGASPKLGNEQTPVELLTPDADEAVSAKKRTR